MFDYVVATSLEEAAQELSEEDAYPIAGGVSLTLLVKEGFASPRKLVSVARVPDLAGVRVDADGALDIGAVCTHGELARDKLVATRQPELARMFSGIGNARVRAVGTVGGNLAHADPAEDPAPLLIALGATVVASDGARAREIPVAELFAGPFTTVLEPDEILTRIRVPAGPLGERCVFVKYLSRTAEDYATVSVAVWLVVGADRSVTAARVALGAIGATPVAAAAAADLLVGARVDGGRQEHVEGFAELLGAASEPISDARGSAEYKREMARVVGLRAVERCLTGSWPTTPATEGEGEP